MVLVTPRTFPQAPPHDTLAHPQGGVLIPAAVLGAIASFETARTSGDAQREIFFNIEALGGHVLRLRGVGEAIIIGAFVQRLRIWRIGKPQGVFTDFGARLTNALTMGAGTSRVKNDRFAGVMHWCIYPASSCSSSSPCCSRSTTMRPLLGQRRRAPLPPGRRLPGLQLVGDLFGVIGLLGIGMALFRRYVRPPAKIAWDRRRREDAHRRPLGFVLFTGILVEGLRIGGDEIRQERGLVEVVAGRLDGGQSP